jgi:hypothetical protein
MQASGFGISKAAGFSNGLLCWVSWKKRRGNTGKTMIFHPLFRLTKIEVHGIIFNCAGLPAKKDPYLFGV